MTTTTEHKIDREAFAHDLRMLADELEVAAVAVSNVAPEFDCDHPGWEELVDDGSESVDELRTELPMLASYYYSMLESLTEFCRDQAERIDPKQATAGKHG